jgi:hypothetical protein
MINLYLKIYIFVSMANTVNIGEISYHIVSLNFIKFICMEVIRHKNADFYWYLTMDCDCKLSYNEGKNVLFVPGKVMKENINQPHNIILSLDPGVGTFLTGVGIMV